MKTIFTWVLVAMLLALDSLSGWTQGFAKSIHPEDYNGNLLALSKQINLFYDTATAGNRSGINQWKRWEWFAMHHIDGNGVLVDYTAANGQSIKEMERMATSGDRSHTGNWTNLGHSSVPGALASQGRVNSVAFDPVNANIIYVATAGGGMWKSMNNGDSWVNLTIDLPILGIADIVVVPAPNNNILYALAGDLSLSTNVYPHQSIGVIKSYDSGLSWVQTNYTALHEQNLRGAKLLMHPDDPNIILAAMSDGIHITRDGGNTWQLAVGGNVNDMEFKPFNPDTVYYTMMVSNNFSKLNINTLVTRNKAITTTKAIDRMEIAVTPDNPNAIYLLAGPGYDFFGGNLFNGLFYSNNSGSSFTTRSVSCSNNDDLFNSARNLSWYANTIYVDPQEENYVIVGGLNLFNSVDGGVTLNQVSFNSVHSDQHNIKRNPLNGHLWLCNDGGLYRSTNSGNTWENKSNGLTISEYYRISGTNNAEDRLIGGTQDNGQFLRTSTGQFQQVYGGDGMDNYFNSFNNSIVYVSSQNGGLGRSTTFGAGFNNTSLPSQGSASVYPWITPFVQVPPFYNTGNGQWENTDVILVLSLGGVLRSFDGAVKWDTIGPGPLAQMGVSPSMVTGRDAGGVNLYICTGDKFWVTPDALLPNVIWYNYSLPVTAGLFVSAMTVNPANRNEVWIVVAGYQDGEKVFRTFNAGVSWTNMTRSLPNTPMYSITFANNANNPSGAVFVGSEIGIFYRDDGLADWVPFSNGLPHVPVTDLQMNYYKSELKAATYGRGIWASDTYSACSSLIQLNYNISQGQYSFESSNQIIADHWINGGLGVNVNLKAANQIKLEPGFWIFPASKVRMTIANCGSGVTGLTSPDETSSVPPK